MKSWLGGKHKNQTAPASPSHSPFYLLVKIWTVPQQISRVTIHSVNRFPHSTSKKGGKFSSFIPRNDWSYLGLSSILVSDDVDLKNWFVSCGSRLAKRSCLCFGFVDLRFQVDELGYSLGLIAVAAEEAKLQNPSSQTNILVLAVEFLFQPQLKIHQASMLKFWFLCVIALSSAMILI
ncbi:hypothetical protein Droror1_Dr00010043 [Drosera rotundifolia]